MQIKIELENEITLSIPVNEAYLLQNRDMTIVEIFQHAVKDLLDSELPSVKSL